MAHDKFFDLLVEYIAFERTYGRDIIGVDMSLGYMLLINSQLLPYTLHYTSGEVKGILKSVLGIPVFVDVREKHALWIKYTVHDSVSVKRKDGAMDE